MPYSTKRVARLPCCQSSASRSGKRPPRARLLPTRIMNINRNARSSLAKNLPDKIAKSISSAGITRRNFLRSTAGAAAGLALGGLPSLAATRNKVLPKPNKSGIEHIVVLMMENRSFDHFLGWLPGAEGKQAGLSYPDAAGVLHPTYALTSLVPPDYQGCGHPDPDHSYDGARVEYDGGACDGWLRAGSNDVYSIGYYTQADLSFLGARGSGMDDVRPVFCGYSGANFSKPNLSACRADGSVG